MRPSAARPWLRFGPPIAAALATFAACDDDAIKSDDHALADAGNCGDENQAPKTLACTGLYADWTTKTLADGVRPYTPALELWSDGARKDRFIHLPAGARIDTSRPDDWVFPVGTRVWKEFRLGERRVETRYMRKVRDDRWIVAAYVWTDDAADRREGVDLDVDGVAYHVPSTSECSDCHDGRRDHLLGFEALGLGLPGASGLTLGALEAEGRIDPMGALTIADDGTGAAAPALGWLHMNCGVSCHNATSTATAYGTGMVLKLGVDELRSRPPRDWAIATTTRDVAARTPRWNGEPRIAPGDPARSLLLRLLSQRGEEQMPPLATRRVDDEHRAAVEAWIRALGPAPNDGGTDAGPTDGGGDAGTGDPSDAADAG